MANEKIKTVKSFNENNATKLVVEWADQVGTVYDMDTLPQDIILRLAHHGLKQKLMDAHAGGTGEYGSIEGCRNRSGEVYELLQQNVWNESGSRTPWVVEAMSDLYDVSIDAAREAYEKLDEKRQKQLAKNPEIRLWKIERDRKRLESQATDSNLDVGALFD